MRFLLLFLLLAGPLAAGEVTPLPRAHAHNDYEHPRPLLDALEQGFCSLEADIHLVNGELLVAHDPEEVQPGKTLEKLYLAPLAERVRRHGGRVYPNGPPVILLVDIKTEAESTYRELKGVLAKHRGMLTSFRDGKIETNAVIVILSGNRPAATLVAENDRFAAFDGRLVDVGKNHSTAFMPLISDNWRTHFTWNGEGEIPEAELKKLREIVVRVHAEKRMIRFWATPDTERAWAVLHKAGVDLLNTDNLSGLASFLKTKPPAAFKPGK